MSLATLPTEAPAIPARTARAIHDSTTTHGATAEGIAGTVTREGGGAAAPLLQTNPFLRPVHVRAGLLYHSRQIGLQLTRERRFRRSAHLNLHAANTVPSIPPLTARTPNPDAPSAPFAA